MSALEHTATTRFWQNYHALPPGIQERADKQFTLLQSNPKHPSLQFKKLGERLGAEWWSARVTQDYRTLALRQTNGFLWFWIGNHKTYEHLLA